LVIIKTLYYDARPTKYQDCFLYCEDVHVAFVSMQYVMSPFLTASKHKTTKHFQTATIYALHKLRTSLQAVPFIASLSQPAASHRKPATCRGHGKRATRRSALFSVITQRV